ncbi:unnamed protein product [Phytomonas sp. Hart1]|nr:unnamed protein product [Phytomonas sp. Hart1]|eukprot:CCW69939.1 unnamed protein product [Phytomonas sp. isolate Hart1]
MAAAGALQTTEKSALLWRFAVLHDSGVVHLVHYSWNVHAEMANKGDDAHTLVSIATLSTGLTAGRGIVWASCVYLFAANEESVMCIQVDETTSALALMAKKRVNVRCVSGFAVRRLTPVLFDVMLSGQGLEYVRFRTPQAQTLNV